LGDLNLLKLVIENMPDEELMRKLEKKRGNGRDDYPVRAMWNSVLAGVIFRHESMEKLIDELGRNGQLRYICGFREYEVIRDEQGIEIGRKPKIPESWNYSRFLSNLMEEQELIEEMFDEAVEELKEILPGFGEVLAVDGKAIESYAKRENARKEEDGRRDIDANTGIKKYSGIREDGTKWEKVMSWFGYKLHLVVDAVNEIPVAFSVTKASAAEIPEGKELIKKLEDKHPKLLENCKYWLGDRGYDDTETIKMLWDKYRIKPIIDMKNNWEKKEEVRMFEGRHNIIGYDNFGSIYCYDPVMGEKHLMGFGGFEEERESLKYICPVKSNGIKCKGCDKCPYYNKAVRIKIEEDRRRFTPVARSSYKWERIYKLRTAVERVNSRIDNVYGFERHFIRGLKKMRLRCSLALIIMLVIAIGRIKQSQPELMRTLKTG
jgi:transposase